MEWQFVGEDSWDFGVKVRGAVRESVGQIYFDPDLDSREGGWVWMAFSDTPTRRGLAPNRREAMARVEEALGVVPESTPTPGSGRAVPLPGNSGLADTGLLPRAQAPAIGSTPTPAIGPGSPLTDEDLDLMEKCPPYGPWANDWQQMIAEVRRLRMESQAKQDALEMAIQDCTANGEEADRLRVQVAGLLRTWMKEPPTEPGWYFHRHRTDPGYGVTMHEVTFQDADPTVPTIWTDHEPDTITGWGGEWAGPYSPPGGTP